MRNRYWRREVKDKYTIKRLKIYNNFIDYEIRDINYIKISGMRNYSHLIGTPSYFMAKSYSTSKYDSRNKTKYSPNKTKPYWRYKTKKLTRELYKSEFFKTLKEYGIK